MNRTQKEAWFSLVGALLGVAIYSFVIIQLFVISKPPGFIHGFVVLLTALLYVISHYVVCRKNQSPREVDKDERDKLIEKRAAIAAFAAFALLLLSTYLVLCYVVGLDGSIPIWSIPIFLLIVVMPVIMLVYSVAILVQYGRGAKEEQSNE